MTDLLQATAPQRNAAVLASAGTGKTWLLVTRLVRLLLHGARPEHILAVTFTRKAAAEMQSRLAERLFHLAACGETELNLALGEIGVVADAVLRQRARCLYQQHLLCERPIRTLTFHALCQELLRRFPLEAQIPPGFELLEATASLENEAWEALFTEATAAPDGPLASALEALLDACGNLYNTRTALESFLRHRSDWWAYTAGEDPVAHAEALLRQRLEIDPDVDATAEFFSQRCLADLVEFAALLRRHPTAANARHAELLERALTGGSDPALRLEQVAGVFLTLGGTPRARRPGNTQVRSMGEAAQARFLSLHETLCARLDELREHDARAATLRLSSAWYRAGTGLLAHFQRLKEERRALDFTDLEWKTYCLLNHSDNAEWVQYKLDQRIEHLLVDEFQDTNPTQWRLLLPLLQEMAAGMPERARSVFLVGDAKQSIYRFRRAEPRLLGTAADWLTRNVHGERHTMNISWRAAPAVVDAVNRVFGNDPLASLIDAFEPHTTHHGTLWGRAELLPLVNAEPPAPARAVQGLRNPLHAPRVLEEDQRHYREGQRVAARIRALLDAGTVIGAGEKARPLTCDDIFILLRNRIHAAQYECALRDAGVPYVGAERGALLESLEVRDLVALLEVLIAPFDNLALVQVLRSPMFAVGDDDLARLAKGSGHWIGRLQDLAPALPPEAPLARAARWLGRWRELVGRIPVHDLLDRIYSEGDVPARYEAAFPQALRGRVGANLTRFIELALEVDSGRYPSLPRFLSRLRELRADSRDAPDAAPVVDAAGRVRMLTIHAAKGLEAPAVFIVDAASSPHAPAAFQAVIGWPADSERPNHFLLAGKRPQLDAVSRALLDAELQAQQREDANLLYVAMTRARQLLFISACAPGRGEALGWYGAILKCVGAEPRQDASLVLSESGTMPRSAARPSAQVPRLVVDPRLAQPLQAPRLPEAVTPSTADIPEPRSDDATAPSPAQRRGVALHRMLQLASVLPRPPVETVLRQVGVELGIAERDVLRQWWGEVASLLEAADLRWLYDPTRYRKAYNEVPVQYQSGGRLVHGVIDRLVVTEAEATVVDYKTHAGATRDRLAALAGPYLVQLGCYREAVRLLWPGKPVRAVLIFTACAGIYQLP